MSLVLFLPLLFILLATLLFLHRKSPRSFLRPPPADEIVSLRIYPIKSCRGIVVKCARLLRTGLDLDRNWMFITQKGEFITIRANPRLTLINTALDVENDRLLISVGNGGDGAYRCAIPAHPSPEWLKQNTQLRKVTIWGEETDAWEYAASLSQPFADFLGVDVRLVYKGPSARILRGSGAPKLLGRSEAVKFADMMPVLVGSLASIDELNGRLRCEGEEEITIERFRPNVIVRGHEPWNEDRWKSLRINGNALDVVCRCLRCHVPNVDPDTAEQHPRQPWKELMKYRRIDEGSKYKPSFGMLCAPKGEGIIEVGMKFEVTEMTNNHFFINPMK